MKPSLVLLLILLLATAAAADGLVVMCATSREGVVALEALGDLPVPVVVCGMGKARAEDGTRHAVEVHEPDAVIFCGIAGSLMPGIEPGSVIVAVETVEHDAKRKPIPCDFYLLEIAVAVARQVDVLYFGIIATGDDFISKAKHRRAIGRKTGACAVDMESAAAARICEEADVPFLAIRGISDSADEQAEEDLGKHWELAAEVAAEFTALAARRFMGEEAR